MDKQTKDAAAKLAKEMGLDLSSVVKASLRTFVQTQVFHVEKFQRMTPYLERIIAQARKDFKQGKNTSGPFSTPREVTAYLNSLK
ncbi:MAG: hypothetical protein A3E29_01395 [Candidatus Doudnabacteria bacterium RIFCSPHIGHO2_12_FULL_48_16]|uniref:Uncharacterized protein n=1 Tax=Candidatus Doudnabacteria bacterium RIFCSPHIGHO2_12_FULL_48_16 TaxID=1817838 RepID=A0A1F5PM75_9BACT|nr:MAG: hypothetical protein A3E29_01395 [Candidatus Doudnabacteria bacterium RIFCSPHIGHO2_12_FULL_48_16]